MLRSRTIESAVLFPWQKAHQVWRGGLYVDGAFIEEARPNRRGRKQRFFPIEEGQFPRVTPARHLQGSVIYAGILVPAFGHFLLESLSRLWITRSVPDLPVVWALGSAYTPWQLEILQLLRIRNSAVFASAPTKIDFAIVPEPGFEIPSFFDPDHNAFLSVVEPEEIVRGRRCWLSRTQLINAGGVEGEAEFERRLEEAGWCIYHPEQHPVLDQLRFLSSCEHIAGWEGSAFHSLILLSGYRGKITIFARGIITNPNYQTIAERKGFDQVVHQLPLQRIAGIGKRIRWQLPANVDLFGYLRERR